MQLTDEARLEQEAQLERIVQLLEHANTCDILNCPLGTRCFKVGRCSGRGDRGSNVFAGVLSLLIHHALAFLGFPGPLFNQQSHTFHPAVVTVHPPPLLSSLQ